MEEPKEIKECPFCDNTKVLLEKKDYSYKNYTGQWYYYKCDGCSETFTTTESDTISQNGLTKIG